MTRPSRLAHDALAAVHVEEFERHGIRHYRLTWRENGDQINARKNMQETVIDQDYPGLVEEADCFRIAGNVSVEGSLRISLPKMLVVDGSIEVGWGIVAGWGIKAGEGIEAGGDIEAGWGIKAGDGIEAGGGIVAGGGIEAGWGIKAGDGIKAGGGIVAGWGIKAGEGIEAGRTIRCAFCLRAKFAIFAGICAWSETKPEDRVIEAKEVIGEVRHGDVKLIGDDE